MCFYVHILFNLCVYIGILYIISTTATRANDCECRAQTRQRKQFYSLIYLYIYTYTFFKSTNAIIYFVLSTRFGVEADARRRYSF